MTNKTTLSRGTMKKRPTDAQIRGIVSSMNIEGFNSTYESVKISLTDLYEHFDPDDMERIVAEIDQSGVESHAIIQKYLDELAAGTRRNSRESSDKK